MNPKLRKRAVIGAVSGLAAAVAAGLIVNFTGLRDAELHSGEEEETFMEEDINDYPDLSADPGDEIIGICTSFAEDVCERSHMTSDGREGYEHLTAGYRKTLEGTGDPEKTVSHYRENEIVQNLIEVENAETISSSENSAQAAVSCRCRYAEAADGFADLNGVGEGEEFTLLMFMDLEREDGEWKISGCNVIQC